MIETASKKAERIPTHTMCSQVQNVLRVLRGGNGVSPSAVDTILRDQLVIAKEMVGSYEFDHKTGVSTFTVPAGVTHVAAMEALNAYFRMTRCTLFLPPLINPGDLEWFGNLPTRYPEHCPTGDSSEPRGVTITAVVEGTDGKNRHSQTGILGKSSLVLSDPRDLVLAAALHACKYDDALLRDLKVRCSVPEFVVHDCPYRGITVSSYGDKNCWNTVFASGSPSLEPQ
jgi:hypothetical protein